MIVRESINFERGTPPRKSMGLGQFTKIENWLEKYYKNVSNATRDSSYTINKDFTIDIKGFFAMEWEGNLPNFINFNKVWGNFYLGHNTLTSLRGCPNIVHAGDFDCCWNNLKNLVGGPKEVYGNYYCGLNPNLESLEGLATYISGSFACNNSSGLTRSDIPAGVVIKRSISVSKW